MTAWMVHIHIRYMFVHTAASGNSFPRLVDEVVEPVTFEPFGKCLNQSEPLTKL